MDNTPINYKRKLNIPWLFQMAWRDSRKSRSRLFLFVSSIIFGIAALVAIYTFGFNLKKDIDAQAATPDPGADMTVYSGKACPMLKHKNSSIRWATAVRRNAALPRWWFSQKARIRDWPR